MRAIENDRWMVRATNTGYSAFINPQGVTIAKISAFLDDDRALRS
jgi:apolipoprotein N-acyltransferase